MSQGTLCYNYDNDRYGLIVGGEWKEDGFHCGDCMQVMVEGEWTPTRIEFSGGDWYLVGTPYCGDLDGIRARLKY